MKKFNVEISNIQKTTIVVEANDEDEAYDMMVDYIATYAGWQKISDMLFLSDAETDIHGIEETKKGDVDITYTELKGACEYEDI